jgi:hypothetical protein
MSGHTVSTWSRTPGKTKDILERFRSLLKSDETVVLEFRVEREMVEIYDGPVLLETVPTGIIRAEMKIACPGEMDVETKEA